MKFVSQFFEFFHRKGPLFVDLAKLAGLSGYFWGFLGSGSFENFFLEFFIGAILFNKLRATHRKNYLNNLGLGVEDPPFNRGRYLFLTTYKHGSDWEDFLKYLILTIKLVTVG